MRVLNKRDQFTEMNKKEDEYALGVKYITLKGGRRCRPRRLGAAQSICAHSLGRNVGLEPHGRGQGDPS